MLNHGSVQHMKELSQTEKDVFKTFKEISPMEIITQAAQRQQYIDQAQSLNSVSYTHLDVYKRQVILLFKIKNNYGNL